MSTEKLTDVTIPVEPAAAAALDDPRNRAAVGDDDLLVLHPCRGVRNLRPTAYLAQA